MRSTMLAALISLILAAPAGAAGEERWLHVHVDEGASGDRVRLNVPLSMVAQILPAIHADSLRGGRVRIDGAELGEVDVRAIWQSLRGAKDGEYVTVRSREDGDVTVSKRGGMMLVTVDETGGSGERVRIRVPVAFMDALFAPGGGELDVAAAMDALSASGEGEIVTVEGGNERVRIWVDRNAAAAD